MVGMTVFWWRLLTINEEIVILKLHISG